MLKCYRFKPFNIGFLKFDNNEILINLDIYIKSDGNKIISLIFNRDNSFFGETIIDTNETIINSSDYEIIVNKKPYKILDLVKLNLLNECTYKLKPRYYKVLQNFKLKDEISNIILLEDDIIEIEGFNILYTTKYIRNDNDFQLCYKIQSFRFIELIGKKYIKDVTEQYTRDAKLKKLGLC